MKSIAKQKKYQKKGGTLKYEDFDGNIHHGWLSTKGLIYDNNEHWRKANRMSLSQFRIFAQEQELGYISSDEDLWPKAAFYCLKCPQDAKRKTIGLCQFVKIYKG